MAIYQDKYSEIKINRIYQILLNHANQGMPQDYELLVDNFKVIQRTDDVELFESYSDFVDADTRSVTVVIYNGASPRNDKHILFLKGEPEKDGLNGVEGVDNRIQEKLSQERARWDHELLEKEHKQLQKDFEKQEQYIEELEIALAEVDKKKFQLGNINLGELSSVALEGILRRNPQILNRLPGGEALAGVFANDATEILPQEDTDEEVTFSKTGSKEPTQLTEEELSALQFGKQILAHFEQGEVLTLVEILDVLSKQKALIASTLEYLKELTKDQ